jgi:glycosyltransferase involved in cell wall biosynthesis
MIIAVNTRFLLKDKLEGYGYFVHELFRKLTTKFPEHQFYFLFDRPFDDSFIFSENVKGLIIPPPARHPVLWKYWYDIKIPLMLKKIKADIFISPDGYCSLTTSVPQCLVVHDLGFLHHPETYKKSHVLFYKRYTPKFLKKAASVVTVSQFSKKDLVKRYQIRSEKIHVVPNAVKDIFQPVAEERKVAIKEKYTEGKEFFIYAGAIQPRKNLINLLKAFSIFKKRLQSSMKLVLAGRLAWKNDEFIQLLNTYKYKKDVVMTGYLEEQELANLMGSAYALIYPSFFEGFGVPVLEAMNGGIPALTSKGTSMEEIAGEAGLYFDPHNYTDISEKLMLIYKDESLRNRMVEKGREIARQYSWEHSASLMWEAITSIVKQQS